MPVPKKKKNASADLAEAYDNSAEWESLLDTDAVAIIRNSAKSLPPQYLAILTNQFESIPKLIEDIRRSIAADDIKAAENTSHKLKTNSLTFGAQKPSSLAQKAETFGRNEQSNNLATLLGEIGSEYTTINSVISNFPETIKFDIGVGSGILAPASIQFVARLPRTPRSTD